MGGSGTNGVVNTVDTYNPITNIWTTVAPLPIGAAYITAATGTNGAIYIIGDDASNGTVTGAVYTYNPNVNTWNQVASVPLYSSPWGLEGTDAATTGLDGTIYAFSAGWANSQVSAYNQTTDNWTQIASHLYYAYGKAATTGLDGTIYVMGGYATNYAAVSEVDAYTPIPLNLTVTTLADDPSAPISGSTTLRDAITQANARTASQEIINFASGLQGTIDLTQALPALNNNITINGPGVSNLTVQRDSSATDFPVLTVDKGATVSVFGLTISGGDAGNDGGYPGGGGLDNSGTLTVSDSVFSNNTAGAGGAIFNGSGGTLVVTGSTFIDNGKYVTAYGSGIFNENGATATVTGSTFTGNSGTGDGGGGIFNEVGGTLTVSGSIFTGNVLSGIVNGGVLTVSGSTFTGNSGAGGILNGGTLTVTDSTFTSNSSYNNGGGISSYGTVTVSDSTFSGNSTSGFGGGIANDGGTLTVSGSTFTGNSANIDGLGGGIYNGGTLTVSDSTFTSNSANAYSGSGGGLWNYRTAILTNCTFTNNSAIYNGYAGSSGSGGGIASVAGSLTLNNTIVAGNQASVNPDFYGAYTGSHNLIGGNPLLGPLANNGGPTQTMALLPGSPAIDAGSNALAVDPTTGQPLAYDQRGPGFPRILGHSVDIGAYESSLIGQTISFGLLLNQVYGVAPITLTATATSNLPVSYTVISGPATISGSVLTITGAGLVDVEADQAGNATYNSAPSVDESFTVAPASLTITASNDSKTYGMLKTFSGTAFTESGLVNGDTITNVTEASTGAATSATVGTYNIVPSAATGNRLSNYTITYINGTLKVNAAPLTITGNNDGKTYGTLKTFNGTAFTKTGLINGDTITNVTETSIGAGSLTTVGTYPIVPSAATGNRLSNYTITYINGTLTVNPAPLTITANNATKAYGASLPLLGVSYSGFVNGDTAANLITPPTLATTATASSHVFTGGYPITAAGTSDPDYTITYVLGTLTVTVAPLSISADNVTKVYGAGLPTLTASYTGWFNGDSPASLATPTTLATTATALSHVLTGGYTIIASGANDPDYAITYQPGTLLITPAPLTVMASNTTKVYGSPLPTLSASYSGLVIGDSAVNFTALPTLSTTASASSHVFTGGYSITASGASDPDYTITYVPGTLTITPGPLTVTANNATKVYGAALPVLSVSYSGLVNGDSPASLASPPVLSTTASSASHVSSYAISASGAASSDYTISYVGGTLSVTPASLSISADSMTMVYGSGLPTLTVSYAGWVNGDTPANLASRPTLSTAATNASHVGSYGIYASGATSGDYAIGYFAGTLSVTPAPLTITTNDATKTYGTSLPTLSASYSGLVNGDTVASLTAPPTLSTTATASSHVRVGGYPITASGASDQDYRITYVPGTLTILPVPLTITADGKAKVYGAALPSLSASYSGLVNGDAVANLTMPPTLTTTATASSHVLTGGYAITAAGASDPDYTITYQPGTLTITAAPLTVTANNASKVYGTGMPTLTTAYNGFVNGDAVANLTTPPTLSTTATASSHVGSYAISAKGASSSDYTISYAGGTLIVTPAPLTITGDSKTKVYGSELPALTASYSGWINGDSPANLTTQPALSTTATASSHVGSYSILASGVASSDYTISYAGGTLSVTPAPLTITANNETKVYGAVIPTLTVNYDGFVNGDTATSLNTPPVLTTTATASSNVLSDGYDITVSGASDSDYTLSYIDGTLTVTPALLTVTATNKSMTYGGTVPALTYTYTGLVNGDTSVVFGGSLATTATSSSSVGGYPITAGTLAATGNYTVGTYNPSTLTIAKADTFITVTPYGVTYDGNVHNATGTSLPGLVIKSAHTNAGSYTDSWTYTDPNGNYNSSTGIITDTIAKANANVTAIGYNTFYSATPHTAVGAVIGVNGTVITGLDLSNTVHTAVGTYADIWTFSNPNYNLVSGVVADTITPSKFKMVRETVLVPKTTIVKVTELVPVIKKVKVVERVKVGNKWVNKTVLVPKTVMVKKTVLVNVTKMTKKTKMVKVYYN